MKTYTQSEVYDASLRYFNGDSLATNTFFKYVLQDKKKNFYELTPDDMHHRLAREFARIERFYGGEGMLNEKQIYSLFGDFQYIVPQGSPMMGIGNDFLYLSLSNCIVTGPPEDTMSSIMERGRNLANLFKRRCGVGLDLSLLRPEGTPVNNAAGSSTGAWSFADYYSSVCRMVGQNNRRGALMLSMDVRHPDIFKFTTMKQDLRKVTGANVSIRLTDEFMLAVQNDQDFELRWPIDDSNPEVSNTIRARDLWNVIIECATKTAEPGLLFWDTILKTLPAELYAEQGFATVGVNPCSELSLSAEDSCRLISQSLKFYVEKPFTSEAWFDFDLLEKHTRIAQRLSDDLVDLELEKLSKIIEISDTDDEVELFRKILNACELGRRTGLGTHGLADVFVQMGMRYDSDEALELAEKIYEIRKNASYLESTNLARERGSFPIWDWSKDKESAFIQSLDPLVIDQIKKHGRRNISNLTNAPTGSVSIVSQSESGIEPIFRLKHKRRKKKNHDEPPESTDFVDDLGDRWTEYEVECHSLKDWRSVVCDEDAPIPEYFVTSDQIDWGKRVEMQSVIQKHIDHSISSTINLPEGTSPETVGKIYMEAWEKGLKGVTVYVAGSRTGVLVEEEKFKHIDAPKRPEELECDIHHVSVKGEKWCIFVGLLEGRPYEVFGGLLDNIEIPKTYRKGRILKGATFKSTPNRYDLKVNGFTIKNITKQFDNPTYQVLTRMVSLGLRHGAKPSFLVEQLQKDPDNDLTSFSKVLSRVLKKYILDGEKVTSDKVCKECGAESLVYKEGCAQCTSCGHSKCG